jgi:hypothetical protein
VGSQTTREKIVARLRLISGPALQRVAITDETEIYYDLRIYGHDLYDFVVWLGNEFGVSVPLNLAEHTPREGTPLLLFRSWRERRERERRPYKSLTVRDILGLVERG